MTKGGGSVTKHFYQETKAVLNPSSLAKFCIEKMATLELLHALHIILHLLLAELAEAYLKTVKLASARYYDNLQTRQQLETFRDVEFEKELLDYTL